MPMARPTMLASASGELNTRSQPNARCSPCVTLNTPPLPCTSLEVLARASRRRRPRRTRRCAGSRAISSFSVRLMAATIVSGLPSGAAGVSNAARRRIDVRRVDAERRPCPCAGFGALTARVGGLVDFAIDVLGDRREVGVGREAFAPSGTRANFVIGSRFASVRALRRRLVQLLVVRQRVRVRADDLRVHERRALARART